MGGSVSHAGAGGTSTPGTNGGTAGNGTGGTGCQGPVEGDIRAWFFPEIEAATTNEIHPFMALTTMGRDVPLKELTLRYYFVAELSGDWQTHCIWVTLQPGQGSGCAGTELNVVSMAQATSYADHYLEISFTDVKDQVLSAAANPPFEVRTSFWRSGYPNQIQSNDYSFLPTTNEVLSIEGRNYRETAAVTVYRNGTLVWGQEPCP
jgi:hypothetical protein